MMRMARIDWTITGRGYLACGGGTEPLVWTWFVKRLQITKGSHNVRAGWSRRIGSLSGNMFNIWIISPGITIKTPYKLQLQGQQPYYFVHFKRASKQTMLFQFRLSVQTPLINCSQLMGRLYHWWQRVSPDWLHELGGTNESPINK